MASASNQGRNFGCCCTYYPLVRLLLCSTGSKRQQYKRY
jgi:hypothetical protein